MSDFSATAVVTREDGSSFYRQEHAWYALTDEQAAALGAAIGEHANYLKQLEKDQKKMPEEVFTAVLTATGQETLTFTGIHFDSFEKAARAWNKLGDDLIKAMKKAVKKA
jgi:hypothetical protein